jgi:hypothetical protein
VATPRANWIARVTALCPFIDAYESSIGAGFPGLKVVRGTHRPAADPEGFRCQVASLLGAPRPGMTDVIRGT